MKIRLINYIAAHPLLVSWFIGAVVLNAYILVTVIGSFSEIDIYLTSQAGIFLVLALIPSTFLGFFLGAFTIGPFVFDICRKINGATIQKSDNVVILSGKHKGKLTCVYGMTIGQGGELLLLLDLGEEMKQKHLDIFEQYKVVLAPNAEQIDSGDP